jgi:hypothetical protein
VRLVGAVAAFLPALVQPGQVRVQDPGPPGRGVREKAAGIGGGGIAAHGLAVQVQFTADLGDGQAAGGCGMDLGVTVAGLMRAVPLRQARVPPGRPAVKESQASIASAWERRNCDQVVRSAAGQA